MSKLKKLREKIVRREIDRLDIFKNNLRSIMGQLRFIYGPGAKTWTVSTVPYGP